MTRSVDPKIIEFIILSLELHHFGNLQAASPTKCASSARSHTNRW